MCSDIVTQPQTDQSSLKILEPLKSLKKEEKKKPAAGNWGVLKYIFSSWSLD